VHYLGSWCVASCAVIVTAVMWKTGRLKHNLYMISLTAQSRHYQDATSWTDLLQGQSFAMQCHLVMSWGFYWPVSESCHIQYWCRNKLDLYTVSVERSIAILWLQCSCWLFCLCSCSDVNCDKVVELLCCQLDDRSHSSAMVCTVQYYL